MLRLRCMLSSRYLVCYLGGLAGASLVLVWLVLTGSVRSSNPLEGLATIVLATIAVAYIPIEKRALRRITIAVDADPPVCAVCGYDMAGLHVEDDHCRICPECGAAWKGCLLGDMQTQVPAAAMKPPEQTGLIERDARDGVSRDVTR